jgi:hypothetical protein
VNVKTTSKVATPATRMTAMRASDVFMARKCRSLRMPRQSAFLL